MELMSLINQLIEGCYQGVLLTEVRLPAACLLAMQMHGVTLRVPLQQVQALHDRSLGLDCIVSFLAPPTHTY